MAVVTTANEFQLQVVQGDLSSLQMMRVQLVYFSLQSHAEWIAGMVEEGRKVGRRQKTTGYQKATHFELGSDEQRYSFFINYQKSSMYMSHVT